MSEVPIPVVQQSCNLIAVSQVVALEFQTIAAANKYWRP
ncbi:MAG: hexameric tyrosine-coordinated heme protein [Friedmanniella sp.]|jgi:hypothetical protein